ncbi:MAG: 50S ribosomal protein L10 [Treponema sp.]|nr:50S ribosomal protein L10 [Treponema sp.]
MAMRAKKVQPAKTAAIEAAKKTFAEYNDFIFTDYRGLTMEQITRLRGKLREKNSALKVVKNNFARIAFESMSIDAVGDYLTGPTAIAMAKEDSNEIAKILFDFAKDAPALTVKGGIIEKEIYDGAKIEAFSKVPGKKQLISMLMSAINGPARQLAATIKAYAEKLEKEGPAATAPQSAAAADSAPPSDAPTADTVGSPVAAAGAETQQEAEAAPAAAAAPTEAAAPAEQAAPDAPPTDA